MAVQTEMYSDGNNLGFPLGGSPTQNLFTDHNGTRGLVNCRSNNKNNFCFNSQQQKQHQPADSHTQCFQSQDSLSRNQDFHIRNNGFLHQPHAGNRSNFSRSISLASQMETQKLQIDQLITLQYERLRFALQEQRKQQLASIIKRCESKAQFLLQQKDLEIAKGLNRMMELEQMLKGIKAENQTWERVAKEHEAIINSMSKTVEQLQQDTASQFRIGNGGGVEDAESCCDIGYLDSAKAEESQENGKMRCKICSSRTSCVILLPCRHLCSCNACAAFIGSCPMCNMVKKASIEALF